MLITIFRVYLLKLICQICQSFNMFFSHNKSVNSTFCYGFSAKEETSYIGWLLLVWLDDRTSHFSFG